MSTKVEIEITAPGVIIPKSIYENGAKGQVYVSKVARYGEIVDVYEDVADKLELYKSAVRTSRPGTGDIAELEAKNAQAEIDRRQNLLTGETKEEEEKKTKKTK